ncbi:hypothetical protein [Paraburkholderia caledonica]|uniref:hypothetical protein n=1 Tax=Paraburkholderia caledonica TaxID=134536 RepID=UPI0038BC1631
MNRSLPMMPSTAPPALVSAAGERAGVRFLESFASADPQSAYAARVHACGRRPLEIGVAIVLTGERQYRKARQFSY